MNKALLTKRWLKLVATLEKVACKILKEKYGNKHGTWSGEELHGRDTSHFLEGFARYQGCILGGVKFTLGEGNIINFWKNKWQDYEQLSRSFPKIYEVTRDEEGSVKVFFFFF